MRPTGREILSLPSCEPRREHGGAASLLFLHPGSIDPRVRRTFGDDHPRSSPFARVSRSFVKSARSCGVRRQHLKFTIGTWLTNGRALARGVQISRNRGQAHDQERAASKPRRFGQFSGRRLLQSGRRLDFRTAPPVHDQPHLLRQSSSKLHTGANQPRAAPRPIDCLAPRTHQRPHSRRFSEDASEQSHGSAPGATFNSARDVDVSSHKRSPADRRAAQAREVLGHAFPGIQPVVEE